MKNFLLIGAVALLAVQATARDFAYEYEGQTLNYTVLDEDARTCQVMAGEIDELGIIHTGHTISGSLIIPSVANDGVSDFKVVAVGDYAFERCPELNSLSLPSTLKSIGEYGFYGCSALTEIDIPGSVKRIANAAFADCRSLTKAQFASVDALCTIDFERFDSNPLYWDFLFLFFPLPPNFHS